MAHLPYDSQKCPKWQTSVTQLPSAPVLALSSTPSNATSSQLGQASPPISSDAIRPHPTPLLKASSTNNDNANANILVQRNNQSLQAAPPLTPSMQPFLTPRPPLPAPTATSPAVFRSNQVAAPTTSSSYTKYHSNTIVVRHSRNRTAPEIKRVFQSVVHYLNAQGLRPRLHTLDNEASAILRDYLHSEDVGYQLVPHHMHRRNASKRAICTFKNPFIAGLASTDPYLPLSNWCRLLPQAELTLNLLRASCLNPNRPIPNSKAPSISHAHI